jgi:hypothetical protein
MDRPDTLHVVHSLDPALQDLVNAIYLDMQAQKQNPSGGNAMLAEILQRVTTLQTQEKTDMAALDNAISALQTEVANQTTVDASAVTLMQGLSTQLAAALAAAANAGATPTQLAALTALQTSLAGNDTTMAAAVTANTPAAAVPVAPIPPIVPVGS